MFYLKPFAAILMVMTPTADAPEIKTPPPIEVTDPYWRRDCWLRKIPHVVVCQLPGRMKGVTYIV